jgi:hypothetical protein
MEAGGIYIRWRERLWQEQPDGSYLVWDEEVREWQGSGLQPPRDPKRPVSTRECPNCGKRVKSTLRSCPYCDYGFEPEAKTAPARRDHAIAREKKKRARSGNLGSIVLIVAVVVAVGLVFGLIQARRTRDCTNWKNAVSSYTRTTISIDGLPPGLTEDQFHILNEKKFANKRPGGCE